MAPNALVERLADIDIFKGADDATLGMLAGRARTFSADAGTTIIDQDDEGGEIFAILEGSVRATLLSPRGQEVSFRDQPAGTAIGLIAAIDGRPRSASIVALERARIAAFDVVAMKDAMARSPAVMDAVLQHLCFLVRQLSDRVFEFTTLVARHRVQAELLRLAETAERDGEGPAVIRPAPTSTLTRMGILGKATGALVIRDVAALAMLVDSARDSGE